MKKITWVNFLHLYQPPWQTIGVVEQIASQSYEYLVYLFKKYPHYKATINISGCLLDMLSEIRPDLISDLQKLVKRGQLELTGSAQYHALLPLISIEEARRQIVLNQETQKRFFPQAKISGFYLPEMAYSPEIAKLVKQMGYSWIILDPICTEEKIDSNILYKIKNINLVVIFRDRKISTKYPAEIIFHKLASKNIAEETIISATDGEIYGHRHEDWQGHVEKILLDKNLVTKTISEHLANIKTKQLINVLPGTWESKSSEIKKDQPFILWSDKNNKIHQNLWALVNLSSQLIKKYHRDTNWQWARKHLDQGLTSCTFWWASGRKLSDFSPLTWHPDMIDNGAESLIRSVRSLSGATSKEKIKAENYYLAIKKYTWTIHWKKYAK